VKKKVVFIVALLAFVPAVLAMLPIKGLHSGVPGSGNPLPTVYVPSD